MRRFIVLYVAVALSFGITKAEGQESGGAAQEILGALNTPSTGDNTACWSYSTTLEMSPNITCTPFTVSMLDGLKFATRAEVTKIMREPGQILDDGTTIYISNYDRGAAGNDGDITLRFDRKGKVTSIIANLDVRDTQNGRPHWAHYSWDGNEHTFCSDIPIGEPPCD